MALLARRLAAALGLNDRDVADVWQGALIHDLGKSRLPPSLIEHPGPLDELRRRLMRRHPVWGADLVSAHPLLAHLEPVVRHHHERFDGGGYPDGLSGSEIPLGARIVAVCDSYDAMVADRPYRRSLGRTHAMRVLDEGAGTQWDPWVVRVFLQRVVGLDGMGSQALAYRSIVRESRANPAVEQCGMSVLSAPA